MKNVEDIQYIEHLRRHVATFVGFVPQTRRHFDLLAEHIFLTTKSMLSATTLRRFWGYQEREASSASLNTINVLCRMVGYHDWEDFRKRCQEGALDSSELMMSQHILDVKSLTIGQQIQITWLPNRKVVIEYLGDEAFRVLESVHSKLCVEDSFHCQQIVQGQPLFCHTLLRKGCAVMSYVCGKGGGLTFSLL